ncbi:MAG: DegT/DnrJ/EryC1/StrS family aminotransferase [Planctomycetota bacterium]
MATSDSEESAGRSADWIRVVDTIAWPPDNEAVRAQLLEAYGSGAWGRYAGPYIEQLETLLAQRHQMAQALACSSGTIAVELALRGVGVEAGDEVILAGYDFPGNFRAIEAIGALPVLVDLEADSWCLSPAQLHAAKSPTTRAVIVSHLHGTLADMRAICEWGERTGIAIVEDACQTPGATIQGRPAGGWGTASVLSFGGSKLLTAGRGGAVLTRDAQIHQRIRVWCDRGNLAFPLSELQAAVLLPQWDQLDSQNALRQRAVERLRSTHFPGLQLLPSQPDRGQPSYYKLAWLPAAESAPRLSREALLTRLWKSRLPFDAGFHGFATRTARRCRQPTELTFARRAAAQAILLHHPVLLASDSALEAFITELQRAVSEQ